MGTPYRYWRARAEGAYTATVYVSLIEMREAADGSGANLSTTGNGSASASVGSNPAGAFDGVNGGTSNAWSVVLSTTGQWIQWDFGAGVSHDINNFGIAQTNGAANFTWFFEGSNNGTDWQIRAVLAQLPNATMTYVSSNYPTLAGLGAGPTVLAPAARPDAAADCRSIPARLDLEDGGQFYIENVVDIFNSPDNIPVSRRVALVDERSRRIVRETWSRASDGYYRFDNIRGDRAYSVVAYDHLHNYRAVIADNLTASPMP